MLADHSDDIVMFDVPPPQDGVRGLDRLPGDLAGVLRVAGLRVRVFEIVELEVTAGEDVAFAWALLRCNTDGGPRRATPTSASGSRSAAPRRTTAGWSRHEHHSFADTSVC